MESAKSLQVQDFLLSITSLNSILTLEAKEKSSRRIFTVSIDNDVITQITNGLFTNAEGLSKGLNDAASGSCQDQKLTLDPSGKLTYTMIFSAGTIKREDSFSIDLEEKGETVRQFDSMESRVDHMERSLRAFQGKTEERFNKLENMMQQMLLNITQKFDVLEKEMQVLNASSSLSKGESTVSSGYFNMLSVNASEYSFNEAKRSITLLTKDQPCLEFLPEVPKKGRSTYSLKIAAETSTNGIIFGITTKIGKGSWSPNNCHYRYWTSNGGLCGRVRKAANDLSPYGGTGKTLKMVVDMDKGYLAFYINEREINSCPISTSDTYFACVSLGKKGDQVEVL